ncbi:limbic system-associated membrane protein-like [Haliotis rubra]|uniref:limbic system-associated membrane protein-like n=1 Tax=Haliotis rubra TaxID=36100 RepID=UPI001EE550CA|nr:limbic system-associated membrane protein-like [Haliotis rubra]
MKIYWTFMFLIGLVFCQGPEPETSTSTSTVTVREGETAILPCKIKFKGRYKTVWTDGDSTLLTFEERRIIDDRRVSVGRPSIDEWNLHIRYVTQNDQGQYTCQINTIPVRVMPVELVVTGTDLGKPTSSD